MSAHRYEELKAELERRHEMIEGYKARYSDSLKRMGRREPQYVLDMLNDESSVDENKLEELMTIVQDAESVELSQQKEVLTLTSRIGEVVEQLDLRWDEMDFDDEMLLMAIDLCLQVGPHCELDELPEQSWSNESLFCLSKLHAQLLEMKQAWFEADFRNRFVSFERQCAAQMQDSVSQGAMWKSKAQLADAKIKDVLQKLEKGGQVQIVADGMFSEDDVRSIVDAQVLP